MSTAIDPPPALAAGTFTISADPVAADKAVGELGELATATEWKRAAIVYARVHVRDSQGRPPGEKVKTFLLTPAEYAQRGIHGLRSTTTVRAVWRAWDTAIAEGLAHPVSLGDTVTLPDAEWSDYYTSTPASPPYLRPAPSGEQPDDQRQFEDEFDCGFETEILNEREGEPDDGSSLGLGACPPLASDLDAGEPSRTQQRRNGRAREPLTPKHRVNRAWLLIEGLDLLAILRRSNCIGTSAD